MPRPTKNTWLDAQRPAGTPDWLWEAFVEAESKSPATFGKTEGWAERFTSFRLGAEACLRLCIKQGFYYDPRR